VSSDAKAELVADGGASAASDDLFRAPVYLEAEGVTHTLRVESADRVTLLPLIVREIGGGGGIDAISPYGYPGGRVEGDGRPPDAASVDFGGTGLVTAFVRERLGDPALGGARERSRVQVHDPSRERRIRPRLTEQVRAAERAGWKVERIAGPDADGDALARFVTAYEETMRRTDAAPRYFFGGDYYGAVLSFERSWLLLARQDDQVGAAAIAAVSDGMLHYFLGGTADAALDASPFKNVVVGMLDLADELGLMLNLGGGVTPGDGLERFKRGFANAELPFLTHEIVCDHAAYDALSAGREAAGFFPAYRAT
jgi:hypothetical protein